MSAEDFEGSLFPLDRRWRDREGRDDWLCERSLRMVFLAQAIFEEGDLIIELLPRDILRTGR